MNLHNKVVLVTGGSKGIGKATAFGFAKEGANVIICARGEEELSLTSQAIKQNGGVCMPLKCDVRSPCEVKDMMKHIKDSWGKIDILINNAGTAYYKLLVDTTLKEWEEVIDTNLKGVFLCCKYGLPIMDSKGIIINISSGAGKSGFAKFSAYCASKFGVIGLSESLAQEVPQKVYTLCPGSIDTPLYRRTFGISPPTKPQEVANAIVYLCKRENLASGGCLIL